MIRLVLPYAISDNDYWRSVVPKGWTRSTIYVTPEAKQWKEEVGWLAKAAGVREPLNGPVALRIVHHHRAIVQDGKLKGNRNGNVYDLGNVAKVSIDALKGVVIVDDNHKVVRRILMEYGEPTEKGQLVIEIEELPEVQSTLFPKPGPGATVCRGDLPF